VAAKDLGTSKSEDVYEEKVVTASRAAQSPLDAPNSTYVITEQDIRLSGATQIPELLRRVIGGSFPNLPDSRLRKLIRENRIQTYNLPAGMIASWYRETGAGRPGALSASGLRTFVDPRLEGGRMNAAAEKDIVDAMSAIQSHSASNMVSFTQPGGVAALNGPQEVVDKMVAEFDKRRKYIVGRLNDIEGITCAMPGGAFYVFPNVSQLFGKEFNGKKITNSDDLAGFALADARVALVAGSGFGADNYVRLSYATSMANIEKGLDRLAEAIKKLK
jgi:hypothetical protein